MSDAPEPKSFYTERLPEQFNRALREQERSVEASQRVLDGMRRARASIRVDVTGDGGGTFFLNIEDGELTPGESATQPLLLTLVQDRSAFELMAAEAGDSAMGFLGGVSGLAGDMKLTSGRIENLAGVKGCLRFELLGEGGFALLTHFGPDPIPEQPDTQIRVDADAYRRLRSGELNPQDAFLGGQITVEGDMQLAMQIALAALSPD